VCLSEAVHTFVRKALPLCYSELGEQQVKGIDEPVRVYAAKPTIPPMRASSAPKSLPFPDKPSIAVLPFTNLSGDPEQEYFCDGLVDEIITALSRFTDLFVIARASSFTYKGRIADVRQVGRELGVRYLLEGGVRKAGNQIRITGQLIEAETGAHLLADRYDGDMEDVFELQDKVGPKRRRRNRAEHPSTRD
jgi:adenylate cyclase